MPKHDPLADAVKFLYVTGITVGFLLQIVPLFLHFDRKIKDVAFLKDYDSSSAFRALMTLSACVIGYNAGEFCTFLNLQGAIFGTLISYILPALFFLTMLKDAKKKKQTRNVYLRDDNTEQSGARIDMVSTSEFGVNFEPEESTERTLRQFCYGVIAFGLVGGMLSAGITIRDMIN